MEGFVFRDGFAKVRSLRSLRSYKRDTIASIQGHICVCGTRAQRVPEQHSTRGQHTSSWNPILLIMHS